MENSMEVPQKTKVELPHDQEEWKSACISSCSRGDRPLVELYVEPWVFLDDAQGCQCPFCCTFIHRVVFKEVSGHRVLLKSGPGNRGRSACGPTHVARLEFPRETGLILRCAVNVGNLFKSKQGNRPSCRYQEGRRDSKEVVPGTSVFPSNETGVSGNIWGRIKGCIFC